MRNFEYFKPSTTEEAMELLTRYGAEARILNGGTDLLVRMRDNLINPGYIVDIKDLPGMKSIGYVEGEGFFIGGAVTMNELVTNSDILKDYSILAHCAHEVGSFQLRNKATLTGNVCNASPSGDTLPALYVLEAHVKIHTGGGDKLIPIEDFIKGVRKIALEPGEIVLGVVLPEFNGKTGGAYYKHSRRKDVDLATVSTAVFYNANEWRVCFGAVAATPVRGRKTEEGLNRLEAVSEESLTPILDIAAGEISPISDVRASREYRTHLIKVALKRAVLQAYEEFYK